MSSHVGKPFLARLEGAGKIYGHGDHATVALNDTSFDVRPGEVVLLLGPSGSGKTTLLTLMAGLAQPTSGRVLLLGHDVAQSSAPTLRALRARQVGFVFQTFRLIESLTAVRNVALVMRFAGVARRRARRRAVALLEELGMGHLANKRPRELSQGEKQRVAIARAMANEAHLLIADEPTANLDSARTRQIASMLRTAARGGRAVVVASHDERLAAYADCVLRLEDGALTQRGAQNGCPLVQTGTDHHWRRHAPVPSS